MFLFVESERRLTHTDTPCHRYSYSSCRQTSACIYRDSSTKNVSSVIIYSPPCYSKPLWLSFVEHKRWIFKEYLLQYNESEWRLGLSSSKMTKSTIKFHKRGPYNSCAIFHVFWSYILASIVSIVCAFRSFSGLKASVPFIVIVWKSISGKCKYSTFLLVLFHRVVQVCNNIRVSN